jgi:putative zinc finger/helix-turn-helix YgiT family protein
MDLPFCKLCETLAPNDTHVTLTEKVKGVEITVNVDRAWCEKCQSDPQKLKKAISTLLNNAYREKEGLISTDSIRNIRKTIGLNQRDFARLLGLGEITVARYESGFIPSKANSLRMQHLSTLDQVKSYYQDTKSEISERGQAKIESYIQTFVSIENGNREYEAERFFALTRFFVEAAQNDEVPLYQTKLNKWMFYADFLAFKRYGQSITGSRYVRLSYGPVPNRYDFKYDINPYVKPVEDDGKIIYHLSSEKFQDVMTAKERDIAFKVYHLLKPMRSSEISEISHKEDAWVKTPPGDYVSYMHAKTLLID